MGPRAGPPGVETAPQRGAAATPAAATPSGCDGRQTHTAARSGQHAAVRQWQRPSPGRGATPTAADRPASAGGSRPSKGARRCGHRVMDGPRSHQVGLSPGSGASSASRGGERRRPAAAVTRQPPRPARRSRPRSDGGATGPRAAQPPRSQPPAPPPPGTAPTVPSPRLPGPPGPRPARRTRPTARKVRRGQPPAAMRCRHRPDGQVPPPDSRADRCWTAAAPQCRSAAA